ncbi:hypothetical protein TVAG_196660 [Trichomonas vaginalis G3]|uniref:Uncharacterized protein n=1 Tax=Trichomonas vaginalis (strain ATCC PRA-98 / G3) TaxID=412133 RepID=A2FCY6_TRIV3|nr:hypothetical protein TVAGG3_0705290 [Trichomonas vaginalis G3]EAX97224.1 hypothetical protein TVAG_196660 [Trichomonas vaginalis G3]KAI5509531.1 hypothetical protein TVAGG3_0705290 [Trichomonas vaginalis G3]|eukprot:XP_001310154.1 hypothetical protein [Trichomonas vaginalis G3]
MELKQSSQNNTAGDISIKPFTSYDSNIYLKHPHSLSYSSNFIFLSSNFITIDQSDAKYYDKYYKQQNQSSKIDIDSKNYKFFPITDLKSSYILAYYQKEIRIYNQGFNLLKQIIFEGNISHLCQLPSEKQPSALFLSNNSIYLLDSDKIQKISDDTFVDDICAISCGTIIYKSRNALYKQNVINKQTRTELPPLVPNFQRILKIFSFNLAHIGIISQDIYNKSIIFVQIVHFSADGKILKSFVCKHTLSLQIPDNINFDVATFTTSCVFCIFNTKIGFIKFYQCPILSLFKEIGTIPAIKPSDVISIDISDDKIIFHSKKADSDKVEAKIYTIGHNQYSLPYPNPLALQFMADQRIIPLIKVAETEATNIYEEETHVEESTAVKPAETEKVENQPIKSTKEDKQNEPVPQQAPPTQVQIINQPQVVSKAQIPKIDPEIFRKLLEEEKAKIISELMTEINKDLTEFIKFKLPNVKNLIKDVNTLRKQFEDCIVQYLLYDARINAQKPVEEDVLCEDDSSDHEEPTKEYDLNEEQSVEDEDVLCHSEIYEDAIELRKQLKFSVPHRRKTSVARRLRRIIH